MIDVTFTIASVRVEPHAIAPTLVFGLGIQENTGLAIHAGLLRCQLFIDVRRRRYSPVEGERLGELVGERPRWNDTMHPLLWATVPLVVPRCEGSVQVELPVACSYDFEVASAKYFRALDNGEVPLLFLFSGTLFTVGPSSMQAAQVPWDREARFRLPVQSWRSAMEGHFGDTTWVRVGREQFDALDRVRRERGLQTWDQVIDTLCGTAERV